MNKVDRKPDPAPVRGEQFLEKLRRLFARDAKFQRHGLMIILALVVTAIIVPKGGLIPDYYAPGDIASRDIKAPKDLLLPDLPLTEKKRAEAEDAIPFLYDFDPQGGVTLAGNLIQAIHLVAEQGAASGVEALQADLESLLGTPLDRQDIQALSHLPVTQEVLVSLQKQLTLVLQAQVVGNLQLFKADLARGVLVRDLKTGTENSGIDTAKVIGLGALLDLVRGSLREVSGLSAQQREGLFAVLRKVLRPNLTFNKNETEARKRQASAEIKPVLFQIKKGEMIVREGERVSEEQIKKLLALRDVGSDYSFLRTAAGLLLGILLLTFTCHRFAKRNIRKYRPENRDLLFLVVTFIGQFVLIKLAIFISTALESAFPYIESNTYYYLLPFAVGAMLVRIVLNSEVALIFSVLSSLLLGVLFGNSLAITLYAFIGNLTGAHWVRHCKERATLYRAGMWVSLANVVAIVAIYLMAGRQFEVQLLYKLGFGLVGGFVCAVIVNGTIPLVESAFKYTTDIKLLELANMNTPVLRELMVQAPGTYHHSVIVGNLVESAAEAINANPLLARVAAYYHDIGKIRKPLYFIENIGGLENRHDKLSPSMSALILMSHVKDGAELARENKLGEPLVNIIRQHHGTSLIKFFYDKAKSKADPGVQQIDERDYRYPGPKPQTREAALIMLADAVEAASRTLADPTPARIQGMVQKIINNIFIDGQLDECELTLKDLHNIAKSFNRILAGIFHHRVDYPEPAYKERDKDSAKRQKIEDTYREPAKEPADSETPAAKSGAEDLKRLGMS